MQNSSFTPQFTQIWAENATTDTLTYPIPSTSSVSGRAALGSGFTTTNMTPIAAGGIPPFGQDFNGSLKMLSITAQNYEAGNVPVWSSDFATSLNGYPKYALVQYGGSFYVSTVDGNGTTPGASGASWDKFGWNQFVKQGSSDGSLSTGDQVYIGLRTGITSGTARIGAKIDDTDFGNFAMVGAQTLGAGNWTEQYYTLPSGGSRTISLTFNAPLDGYVLVIGSANYAVQNTNQTNLTISVNGTNLSADQVTGSTSMTNHSCVKVSAGSVTVASYCGTSATNPPNVGHTLSYIYIPA